MACMRYPYFSGYKTGLKKNHHDNLGYFGFDHLNIVGWLGILVSLQIDVKHIPLINYPL